MQKTRNTDIHAHTFEISMCIVNKKRNRIIVFTCLCLLQKHNKHRECFV